MPHPIEKYLSTNPIVSLTEAPYFLSVKEEECDGASVYVVDYDQIRSPRFNNLVDSCRGIVIDKESMNVVCWPFNRFYNLGEDKTTEDSFDWFSSICYSKEDGSLIKVYWWNGKWRIATRGTAFANNTLYNLNQTGSITFKELFLQWSHTLIPRPP